MSKEALLKTAEKIKEEAKSLVEIPTEILGISEHQAANIEQALHVLEQQVLKQVSAEYLKYSIDEKKLGEDIGLFKRVLTKLAGFKQTQTYKDVENKITELQAKKKEIGESVAYIKNEIDLMDKEFKEIRSHIDSEQTEEKIVLNYDTKYFEGFLAVATILLRLPREEKVETTDVETEVEKEV